MPRNLYIYTHEFAPKRGGIATYCHEFASGGARLGQNVTIFAPKDATKPESDKADAPYQLQPCTNHGTHNLPCLWRTRHFLCGQLKHAPEGLHLLAEPGPILAYGMLTKAQAKGHVAITLHGSEVERWKSNPFSKYLARRAIKHAASIQAVSDPVLNALIRDFPEAAHKARVHHSALPQYFREASCGFQREANNRCLHLLSVGRIHPRKRYEDLIQAIARLEKDKPGAYSLTIAGASQKPSYLAQLKQLAQSLDLTVNWKLDPSDHELAQCYRAADAFALTSLQRKSSVEGYGLVFLEAGAFALPCLAYASGGMVDAIKHEETGYLIPPGDIDQLAERIRFLHDTPDVRLKMGHNNRNFALFRRWEDVVTTIWQQARIKPKNL